MPGVAINWWTVLVTTLISVTVGGLWYSPAVFGKQWSKLLSKKKGEMGDPAAGYAVITLGTLIQMFILVHFVRYAGAITGLKGAETGFWLWLGFIAVVMAGSTVFERRPWKLWGITAGYYLVILLINGALLAAWR